VAPPSARLPSAPRRRCNHYLPMAAVMSCGHGPCCVPPQVCRPTLAHARVSDSNGRRRRARFIPKECVGCCWKKLLYGPHVPGKHAHRHTGRSLAESVQRSVVTAGVWSPAGGWWADPVHWRRNTALAFLCVLSRTALPLDGANDTCIDLCRTRARWGLSASPPCAGALQRLPFLFSTNQQSSRYVSTLWCVRLHAYRA